MKASIAKVITELQTKCLGYLTNTSYLYGQLCVKAEAMSLLGFEITTEKSGKKIENVADAIIHDKPDDDDKIDLFPKNGMSLDDIGAGVRDIHPEFKQSREKTQVEDEEYEESVEFLRLTMPEVDDDRRDVLNKGVDAVHDITKGQLDAIFTYTAGRLTVLSVGESPEEIKQVKDMLEENKKKYEGALEEMTSDKKKQIEDAYQRYLKKKAEGGDDGAPAGGPAPGQSIKMN